MIVNAKRLSATHPQLNGVYCDGSVMIATDGVMLAAMRADSDDAQAYIIPITMIDKLKGQVNITYDKESNLITIVQNNATITACAISGEYPDWKCTVPKHFTGQLAQFNPQLLGVIGKAAKYLTHPENVRLVHNGTSPTLVDFKDPDFFAIIMPTQHKDELPTNSPYWI